MNTMVATEQSFSAGKLFLKATLLAIVIAFGLLLLTGAVMAGVAYHKFNQFLSNAEITKDEFTQTIETGLSQQPSQENGYKNVLLLGVDTLETRGESLPLTDTMMLISLNMNTGSVTTLPLPRDLWHEEYKTKINALYTYGFERFPDNPARFPEETIESMTGIPIHHTVVLSMDQVGHVIDLLGGVEIDVKEGFTDTEFPRSDVDVTVERDPAKLYETISFSPGKQTMSGETALKFIRSRHSEGDQGTDLARSQRQQQVITAVIDRIKQKDVILNTKKMGVLYRYYLDTFANSFSPEEGLATLKTLYPLRNQVKFNSHELTVFPDDEKGAIVHPLPKLYNNQWVYIPRDEKTFTQSIQEALGMIK
jgi:anionic cell wall polymer biosynthesis LytR-Cps2A-Psr (LCP) family protein